MTISCPMPASKTAKTPETANATQQVSDYCLGKCDVTNYMLSKTHRHSTCNSCGRSWVDSYDVNGKVIQVNKKDYSQKSYNKTPDEIFKESPTANPILYRSYARRDDTGNKESWGDVSKRVTEGIAALGNFTPEEKRLVYDMQYHLKSLVSGRWLWVGNTAWVKKPENYFGAYNCSAVHLDDYEVFGLLMNLAMQGTGTGTYLGPEAIAKLPIIKNHLNVVIEGKIGQVPKQDRIEFTKFTCDESRVCRIIVGDSRSGWCTAYQKLLDLAVDDSFPGVVEVFVNVSNIRPKGEPLKGFGGVANPNNIDGLFSRCANILNGAVGRQLNSVECWLLVDEAMLEVVAGAIRRSAGIKESTSDDQLFIDAKKGLWVQGEDGSWAIDPKRDALRMSNATALFFKKPTEQQCIDSVRTQYYSGEGAIKWVGESIKRCNQDVINTPELERSFLEAYEQDKTREWFTSHVLGISDLELEHRATRFNTNPCVAKDTLILTSKGPRRVDELIDTQFEAIVDGDRYLSTKKGFFETGVKKVYTLKTKEGYQVNITEDHQVLYKNLIGKKWVEASKLNKGDQIVIHNHGKKNAWEGEGNFDQGWLMGCLYGKGTIEYNLGINKNVVILNFFGLENQEKLVKKAHKMIKNEVGEEPISNPISSLHKNIHHILSHHLLEICSKFGIDTNTHPYIIPEEVEKASSDFQRGFLAGLFDIKGFLSNDGVLDILGVNAGIARAIQRMCGRFGVACEVTGPDVSKGWKVVVTDIAAFKASGIKLLGDSLSEHIKSSASGVKSDFLATFESLDYNSTQQVYDCTVPDVACFDGNGLMLHNCGEIIGKNFMCNLSEIHLTNINPRDFVTQKSAFKAGSLSVAALLKHKFPVERLQVSRELDPIVGVSFTGLFNFFVDLFGIEWLKWWEQGRPQEWVSDNHLEALKIFINLSEAPEFKSYLESGREYIDVFGQKLVDTTSYLFKAIENAYYTYWRDIVEAQVKDYCDRHHLKVPNRFTTVQPSGSKSLLTNSSPGWHPPFGVNYIRRMTFRADDPVAKACRDYGYSIVPSHACKDDDGTLLTDINDPRVTEWLVEIPVTVPWSDLPGIDEIDFNFSALAQFDFYIGIQKYWTTHNTSATILFTEGEIEELGKRIYESIRDDEGYISAALLARFDQTFPLMPFEPVSKKVYEQECLAVEARRKSDDFNDLVNFYSQGLEESRPLAACSSVKCEINFIPK